MITDGRVSTPDIEASCPRPQVFMALVSKGRGFKGTGFSDTGVQRTWGPVRGGGRRRRQPSGSRARGRRAVRRLDPSADITALRTTRGLETALVSQNADSPKADSAGSATAQAEQGPRPAAAACGAIGRPAPVRAQGCRRRCGGRLRWLRVATCLPGRTTAHPRRAGFPSSFTGPTRARVWPSKVKRTFRRQGANRGTRFRGSTTRRWSGCRFYAACSPNSTAALAQSTPVLSGLADVPTARFGGSQVRSASTTPSPGCRRVGRCRDRCTAPTDQRTRSTRSLPTAPPYPCGRLPPSAWTWRTRQPTGDLPFPGR